jgi:hypothetical protein
MKTNKVASLVFAVGMMTAMMLMAGCSDSPTEPAPPPPPEEDAFIKGRISLDPGVNIDLSNARVAVYTSPEDWENDAWVDQAAVTRSGNGFQFTVGPLNPGTYYLDIWKDRNNSGVIDVGDYFMVYTTGHNALRPIQVLDHQTTTIEIRFTLDKAALKAKMGQG